MLTHPTLDQLHQLGLAGMARAFIELADPTSAALSHAEWLALVDRESTDGTSDVYGPGCASPGCATRRRSRTSITAPPAVSTARCSQALIAGRWIEEAQNLVIEGPAGVGKSWLACALGHKACRDNRSVLYQRIPRMFILRRICEYGPCSEGRLTARLLPRWAVIRFRATAPGARLAERLRLDTLVSCPHTHSLSNRKSLD